MMMVVAISPHSTKLMSLAGFHCRYTTDVPCEDQLTN